MQKKGLLSKSRLVKVEKKLDAEIKKDTEKAAEKAKKIATAVEEVKAANTAKAAAEGKPIVLSDVITVAPKPTDVSNEKMSEINTASANFMKNIETMNAKDNSVTQNTAR